MFLQCLMWNPGKIKKRRDFPGVGEGFYQLFPALLSLESGNSRRANPHHPGEKAGTGMVRGLGDQGKGRLLFPGFQRLCKISGDYKSISRLPKLTFKKTSCVTSFLMTHSLFQFTQTTSQSSYSRVTLAAAITVKTRRTCFIPVYATIL